MGTSFCQSSPKNTNIAFNVIATSAIVRILGLSEEEKDNANSKCYIKGYISRMKELLAWNITCTTKCNLQWFISGITDFCSGNAPRSVLETIL